MQRIFAIALLTIRAAFRYRLVLVMSTLLIGGVIILPAIIMDDGTARGFTQIVLTYTLALITALLGFVTIWLACGTLAREVAEAQLQMVTVKPVARWEIWFGKWLGILGLNAILLVVSGGAVFLMMTWKARGLAEKEQAILRNEVLVARAAAREPIPDYSGDAERMLQTRLAQAKAAGQVITNIAAMRSFALEQIKAAYQVVGPNYGRQWEIDLGRSAAELRDVPLQARVKFNAAQENLSGTYLGLWEVGDLTTGRVWRSPEMSLSADSFHEFQIPANLLSEKGVLQVRFVNRNETALLFPLEDGFEVLYREGGFLMNFTRGLGIIFCWLGFLAALGLACASALSFNVAAFVALGVLLVGLSGGTLKQVVDEGGIMGVNHETGVTDNPTLIDQMAVPVAKGMLWLLGMIKGFSPIDSLSTGRIISWNDLARAVFQIWVVMGGLLAAVGITVFNRRELAAEQSNN